MSSGLGRQGHCALALENRPSIQTYLVFGLSMSIVVVWVSARMTIIGRCHSSSSGWSSVLDECTACGGGVRWRVCVWYNVASSYTDLAPYSMKQ